MAELWEAHGRFSFKDLTGIATWSKTLEADPELCCDAMMDLAKDADADGQAFMGIVAEDGVATHQIEIVAPGSERHLALKFCDALSEMRDEKEEE